MGNNTPKSVQEESEKAGAELSALFNARDSRDVENTIPEETPSIVEKAQEDVVVENKDDVDVSSKTVTEPEQNTGKDKEVDNVWEQRWKQINGKYLSEVPRYASEARALKKQIADLELLNSKLNDQVLSGNKQTTKEITSMPDGLVDSLGEDSARSVISFLENRIKDLEGRFEEKIKPVEKGVESLRENQVVSAKERYINGLDSQSPSWRLRENDPEFNRWLDSNSEGLSGYSYRQVLTSADSEMNAVRVAKIINTYEKTLSPSKDVTNSAKQKELDRMVVPNNSGAVGGKPRGNEPETFSERIVSKFYDDIKHGKFKGSSEDKARLDTAYKQAIYEGRITS